MHRRLITASVFAGAAGLVLAASPASPQVGTSTTAAPTTTEVCTPNLRVGRSGPPTPGRSTDVRGEVCEPAVDVVFTIDGREVGRTVSGADSSIDVMLPVPADLGIGDHDLVATTSSGVEVHAVLRVRNDPAFEVAPVRVEAGGLVTIAGKGCRFGSAVDLFIRGVPIGSTTADGEGSFVVAVRLPASVGTGVHTIIVVCGTTTMANVVSVEAAGAAPVEAAPAFTG